MKTMSTKLSLGLGTTLFWWASGFAVTDLPEDVLEKVYCTNARRLLGVEVPELADNP